MDWVGTLVPVGSLTLGAALGMLGQTLADKRVSRRELEARRDQFRHANFEFERKALVELQELLADFEQSLLDLKSRRQHGSGFSISEVMKIEDHKAREEKLNEIKRKLQEDRDPFSEYPTFARKARLCMYRCGSNSVFNACNAYITSAGDWLLSIFNGPPMDDDEAMSAIRKAEYKLNRAISNALHNGPYDKYPIEDEVEQ